MPQGRRGASTLARVGQRLPVLAVRAWEVPTCCGYLVGSRMPSPASCSSTAAEAFRAVGPREVRGPAPEGALDACQLVQRQRARLEPRDAGQCGSGRRGKGRERRFVCPSVCLQTLVKSFEVTDVPVRTARFVVRKSWIVAGSVSILAVSAILWAYPHCSIPAGRHACACVQLQHP